jgi:ribosome-associated toxin RatA of RatAB toxin-antitoxin module
VRKVSHVVVTSLLSICASGAALARPVLDNQRMSELDQYNVLIFGDPFQGGIDRGKAIGVFDATPDEVFRVVTDLSRYKDYIPLVRSSEVMTQGRSEALVKLGAELPWPAGKTWVDARYQWDRRPGEIYIVEFGMVQGSFKRFVGRIYIEPWSPGKSAVTYELVAVPDVLAPRSALNRGIRRLTGNFVHALRQRVNDLHKLGYLHPEPIRAAAAEKVAAPLTGAPPSPGALKAGR